jgi:hypothetical protein
MAEKSSSLQGSSSSKQVLQLVLSVLQTEFAKNARKFTEIGKGLTTNLSN